MTIEQAEQVALAAALIFPGAVTQWRTSLGPFYPHGDGDFAPIENLLVTGHEVDDCAIVMSPLTTWQNPMKGEEA